MIKSMMIRWQNAWVSVLLPVVISSMTLALCNLLGASVFNLKMVLIMPTSWIWWRVNELINTLFVFCCCVANYHKLSNLKHCPLISVWYCQLDVLLSAAKLFAQGFTKVKSGSAPLNSCWSLQGKIYFQALVGRIQFLVVMTEVPNSFLLSLSPHQPPEATINRSLLCDPFKDGHKVSLVLNSFLLVVCG